MIKIFNIKKINSRNALIKIWEKKKINFAIKRVYIIKNLISQNIREGHAHKKLNQIYSILSGKAKIRFDDGKKKKTIYLDDSNKSVYIKNGTWRDIVYLQKNTVLMVLCDDVYKKEDYIRNYIKYKNWKKKR